MSTPKLGQKKATRKSKDKAARTQAASRTAGKTTAEPKPKPKLAPIRRAPDPDKLDALKELTAPPDVRRPVSNRLPSVLLSKSPDRVAIEEAGDWYKELSKEPRFKSAVAVMIGLRRAYAIALRELNDRAEAGAVELAKRGLGEMPPTVPDFAVQYAMYVASKPFNEHDAMQGMVQTVLPWMAEVIDAHSDADERDSLEEQAARNEARRERPVPVGFQHTPTQEDATVDRKRSVVLVGWANAVHWLLDQVSAHALAQAENPPAVLRLMTHAPKREDQHARLIRLAPSAWKGCGNSDRNIDQMVLKYVEPAMGSPIDLILCDDLAAAFTGGFVGRKAAADAGDAHKRLRKWADVVGAGVVAAVPLQANGPVDLTGPEYEQLRTFTYLRPVTVTAAGDDYRVVVGHEAAAFTVPRETLNAYGRSGLIVPA